MEHFHAMLRRRASLDTSADNYSYHLIYGDVYANIPGKPIEKLFSIGGVNMARLIKKTEEKYMVNTKEAVFYTDPTSGEVLKKWRNPFTEEENEIVHIYNDPVNFPFLLAFATPPSTVCDGRIMVVNQVVPLCYPNPLQSDAYPKYSTGNTYVAVENFVTWAWMKEAYSEVNSVPTVTSWTRTCPWMPWMCMGDRKGNLVFSSHSWKIAGLSEFPGDLLDSIKTLCPKFWDEPQSLETPNKTSWRVFKEELDRRRTEGEPDTQLDSTEGGCVVSNVVRADRNSIDLLRKRNFEISVLGKATAVGSPDRRSPVPLQGSVKISTEVTDSGVNVRVIYDLVESKNGTQTTGALQTAQTSGHFVVAETLQDTLKTSDVNALRHNNMHAVDFTLKNSDKSTVSHVYLVFPEGDNGDVCMTANIILPWPECLGPVANDGYCVANIAG